ncbi:DUF4366 domain-containing protein [Patescibacteria group bacterium]|nr:DUF4366 domain-containing protein [Patescibacteria group bacterium]
MGDENKNQDGLPEAPDSAGSMPDVRGVNSDIAPPSPQSDVTSVDFAARLREEEAAARARAEAARLAQEAARQKAEEERKRREAEDKQKAAERRRAEAEHEKAERAAHQVPGSNRLLIALTVIGVIVVAGLATTYFFYVSPQQSKSTPIPTPSLTPSIPPKALPAVAAAEE